MRSSEGISTPRSFQGPTSRRPMPLPNPPPKGDVECKPYQLKPKREKKEPPLERRELPDPTSRREAVKKLKRLKKKLDELNKKIRHLRKKNDGMMHKKNALRKVIESTKLGDEPPRQEPKFIFEEREQAFGGAYRSYKVNSKPKMDPDTFFGRIREGLIETIK